ncbi:MAG: L,D-transpeptidase family protein [Sphingobium sp.]
MPAFLSSLVKSVGPRLLPKLLIGAGLGGAALALSAWLDRSPGGERRDVETQALASTTPTPVSTPSPAAPEPSPQLVERTRDQPVDIDPSALAVKRVLKIDGPFRHGDYVWDESGAPERGRVIITVDLKAQTLSVFRDGYEIGAAVILYGATDKPSPLGAFPITQKSADHVSNIYNAPMPYMLRLTNDGVAVHGSDVKWGNATHGCIGVPTPFAQKLFGAVKLGDLVVITDGKMLNTGHLQQPG